MKEQLHKRIIISGGGTGGHIFPAISIANAIARTEPGTEILFVGAEGRMEMERVPAAGYRVIGLPVEGFIRRISFRNISVIRKLLQSLRMAGKIIDDFKPDVVVGVGGYASGPMLRVAGRRGLPTLIQEQNSYAGVTNRLLAKRAARICVAYEGMERFFPAEKIIFTGNPVRKDVSEIAGKRNEALAYFGLSENSRVLLVLGGSLGSRTINNSMLGGIDRITASGLQVIWQTGKYYFEQVRSVAGTERAGIKVLDFINRMDLAFAAADIIVSRAGAGTISELCLAGKPVVLVPSPNVAEDHQTKNAMALSTREAAILVTDSEAPERLIDEVIYLAASEEKMNKLSVNIKELAVDDADIRIAQEILKLAE